MDNGLQNTPFQLAKRGGRFGSLAASQTKFSRAAALGSIAASGARFIGRPGFKCPLSLIAVGQRLENRDL